MAKQEGRIVGKMPDWVIAQINVGEVQSLKEDATLIQDKSFNKQFSIKMPKRMMKRMGWQAGDKIEISMEGKELKLKKKGN
ncbi:MAG: hypothetical protein KGH94_03910 [Candidatus Micrarchaeota archaeon]|nr:hypothetical protein [Candidatus Micrarchaeota archaeon]